MGVHRVLGWRRLGVPASMRDRVAPRVWHRGDGTAGMAPPSALGVQGVSGWHRCGVQDRIGWHRHLRSRVQDSIGWHRRGVQDLIGWHRHPASGVQTRTGGTAAAPLRHRCGVQGVIGWDHCRRPGPGRVAPSLAKDLVRALRVSTSEGVSFPTPLVSVFSEGGSMGRHITRSFIALGMGGATALVVSFTHASGPHGARHPDGALRSPR
jgi:hypothetical protein